MPKTTTEKADELVAKANELLKAAEELKAQAAREEVTRYRYPKEPRPGMNKFTIAVRFRGDSQWYQFLILRVPGKGYFTTGRQKNAWFATWENFIDWLRSDDVTQCGKLCSLNLGVMEMTVP